MKIMTVTIIHQGDQVLLGMKKRGFGAGRWNGFGGKVGPDESIEDAAKRELLEEASIEITDFEKLGVIDFEFDGNPEILQVHFFKATQFTGEPQEGEEMKPQWYSVTEIPFDEMWPDDPYWIPLFLANKKFTGHFLFGEGDTILKQELHEVEAL